jgi:large subunit ribosomal protein L2
MAKRIITQRRGKGSMTYRVRRKAYSYHLNYPKNLAGNEATVVKFINSAGHSAPIAKINWKEGNFYIPAFNGMFEGQKIKYDEKVSDGNILELKNIPVKTKVYNLESKPGDGGKFIKSGGTSATVSRVVGEEIFVLMPSKKEKKFNPRCRAVVGVVAGAGRLDKPLVKAGKQHFIKKSKNKLWPRTSAIKMNATDHPFGSGRGKNPKSKIAKRNAPPGANVGHLRPRRTGYKR